jgi:hypothetical protein
MRCGEKNRLRPDSTAALASTTTNNDGSGSAAANKARKRAVSEVRIGEGRFFDLKTDAGSNPTENLVTQFQIRTIWAKTSVSDTE